MEYGYASRRVFAACVIACVAVSRVGRGIRERRSGFSDGCAFSMEVIRGRRESRGRVAKKKPPRSELQAYLITL